MKKLSAALGLAFYWMMSFMSFRPAVISELDSDQCLLFEGTTCKVCWKTKGAYRVKVLLNGRRYKNYKPNGVALLPVCDSFLVELVAQSIYGVARQLLSINVNYVHFKEAEKFTLSKTYWSLPKVNQSVKVCSAVIKPLTPGPVLKFVDMDLDHSFLSASRESLEQEIISNSYQSETNI